MILKKQQKSFYVVLFSSILILVSILFSGTYAYITYNTLGSGNEKNNQMSVGAANMTDLVLRGDTIVANTNMIPGESITSTFTVTNNNDIALCFELFWTDVTNTFVNKDGLVVSLSDSDGNILIDNQPFPSATSVIEAGIPIAANTVITYQLTITFLDKDYDQKDDMGKTFGGTISSDLSACSTSDSSSLNYEILSGTYFLSNTNESIPVVIKNKENSEMIGNILYKEQILESFVLPANTEEMYHVFLSEEIFNTLENGIRNYLTVQITSPYVFETQGQVTFVKQQEMVSIVNVVSSDPDDVISYTENTLNIKNNLSSNKASVIYTVTFKNNSNVKNYKFRNISNMYSNSSGTSYTTDIDLSDGIMLGAQDEYTFDLVYNYDSTINNDVKNILLFEFKEFLFEGSVDKLITVSVPATNTQYGDFLPSALTNSLDGVQSGTYNCSYDACYSGNNGLFEYSEDGGLVLDEDNPIGELEIDQSMGVNDAYTVYVTLKGDYSQVGYPTGKFPGTVLAISETPNKYLSWIGFFKNYLHVYSYRNGSSMSNYDYEYTEEAYASIPIADYSNQLINIQVTAVRGGDTKVYINGSLIHTFASGVDEVTYKAASLGDLRPGRGLKFIGTIYDVGLYNKALTEEEVQANWQYAKKEWNISYSFVTQ